VPARLSSLDETFGSPPSEPAMTSALFDLSRTIALIKAILKFGVLPMLLGPLAPPALRVTLGARLRMGLEELGITYLKLGQYLAMRFDILPPAIGEELGKLFERITPASIESVRAVIESDLGGPLDRFYAAFDPEPVAAASVAQVHRARTHQGSAVAVKVQRLGIQRVFEADIRNLRRMAAVADMLGLTGSLSTSDLIDEFATWTLLEMDFRMEGRTADRLRASALPYEYVPEIHWNLTTEKILTMEFIDGISMAALGRMFETGGVHAVQAHFSQLDLGLLLQRFTFTSLHQLFITGFFHGDPHPGNILVRENNTVVFIDYGIFGELGTFELVTLRQFIEALALGNVGESLRHYMKLIYPTPESDERACRTELAVALSRWYAASTNPMAAVHEIHLGTTMTEFLEIVRRHHYRLNRTTMLFWRALIALDATALQFPGHFDLLKTMQEFFQEYSPSLADRLRSMHADRDRLLALGGLARSQAAELDTTLRRLIDDDEWTVIADASAPLAAADNRRARSVTLVMVGLSLAILATAPHVDTSVRLATLALLLPVFIWTAAEARS
jgi:ubiquinone biosynthesis protein